MRTAPAINRGVFVFRGSGQVSEPYRPHRVTGLLWLSAIVPIANAAYHSDNGVAVVISCVAIVCLAVAGIATLVGRS